MPATITWPIGYLSESVPSSFVEEYQSEIETWVLQPFTPGNESIQLGGVDLIRRTWSGIIHVAPLRPIDEWMLRNWPNPPAATPA